jgi:hypothetical protein
VLAQMRSRPTAARSGRVSPRVMNVAIAPATSSPSSAAMVPTRLVSAPAVRALPTSAARRALMSFWVFVAAPSGTRTKLSARISSWFSPPSAWPRVLIASPSASAVVRAA